MKHFADPEGDGLTPRQVVAELDRYVVGQDKAKRAVAVALRNRWRRLRAPEEIRDEILPNNIIMIGPTGVGKTEIARRVARLVRAPFVKVEASKFTEVGYVGRDVESMIRDLVELAVSMVRDEKAEIVRPQAERAAEERLLDLLLPTPHRPRPPGTEPGTGFPPNVPHPAHPHAVADPGEGPAHTREKLRRLLREGKLEEREVEVETRPRHAPLVEILGSGTPVDLEGGLGDALGGLFSGRSRKRRVPVREARTLLVEDEADRLVDKEKVTEEALERVQHSGIVFIDEIDKIAGGRGRANGPDVSREGVQRDLLPIVEGSTVPTKHGLVKTDHVLFIAAGAFHGSRPSDLIPELQGRFPIRVELEALGRDDFVRILTEPRNALLRQYEALLATEEVRLVFQPAAVDEIAATAAEVNSRSEDIGARRLQTVLSALLEEILFATPEEGGGEIVITPELVRQRLDSILEDEDLSRYIL